MPLIANVLHHSHLCSLSTGLLLQKDSQIANLESKIAEVMAVMPASSSFTPPVSSTNSPHFSATFTSPTPPPMVMEALGLNNRGSSPQQHQVTPPPTSQEELDVLVKSSLNPNASDYTPKQ